jgi:sugar phosphate isomerase/epimerase
MSTTATTRVERAVAASEPANVEPVELDADALESSAPEYLRDLKTELAAEGYQPASLRAEACFSEDCSLATQREADRLREVVRAASFLGVGRLTVEITDVSDPDVVEPALAALAERAEREGVTLSVDGPVAV